MNKEHEKQQKKPVPVSRVTFKRPFSTGEGPLTKESGENMETHGPQFSTTAFEMDLNRYVDGFNEQVIGAYASGKGMSLPADVGIARSFIPPGTGQFRDFSHVATELPVFFQDKCVACMECVVSCPDTAILAKVANPDQLDQACRAVANKSDDQTADQFRSTWTKTTKFHKLYEKKGETGGFFTIYIDPTKCKGCGECVEVCGNHQALEMTPKSEELVETYREQMENIKTLPETPPSFLTKNLAVDAMLKEDSCLLYVGGAGSCAGCGEATAIRMMLAATGEVYGKDEIGIIAATGCNTVYGSTYPYNPFLVTWSNSLFENSPAVAMGVRKRWDQQGMQKNRLWVLGGDGAMYDIGFQALSRMLTSGMDIKVLILDTQVYSNTGGQASTATFQSQAAKMAPYGKKHHGKGEQRKEISTIAMMHPNVYVAQTSATFINHFFQAIREANSFPGPAVVNVYTTCQPEHGVADDVAALQSRRAVNSRAFPLLIHDPRKGDTLKERLSLRGNPAMAEDWMKDPKTKEPYTFIDFARSEGRFAKHFDKEGNPTQEMLDAKEDRLRNWRLLRELAGGL